MIDSAISYGTNGSMSVDTYGMDGTAVGVTDHGEALYDFGGVTMTAEQAEANSDYFLSDDDGYGNNGYDQDDYGYEEETLPSAMLEGLGRINDALGGGASEWIADELLGMGDSRMDEVMSATYMSHDEIQSHTTAVVIDLAHNMGMNSDMLMDALQDDINTVREMRSDRGMQEMHRVISDAVNGEYHAAMSRWNDLRYALSTLR